MRLLSVLRFGLFRAFLALWFVHGTGASAVANDETCDTSSLLQASLASVVRPAGKDGASVRAGIDEATLALLDVMPSLDDFVQVRDHQQPEGAATNPSAAEPQQPGVNAENLAVAEQQQSEGAAANPSAAEQQQPGAANPSAAEQQQPGNAAVAEQQQSEGAAANPSAAEQQQPGAANPSAAEQQQPGNAAVAEQQQSEGAAANPSAAEQQQAEGDAGNAAIAEQQQPEGGATNPAAAEQQQQPADDAAAPNAAETQQPQDDALSSTVVEQQQAAGGDATSVEQTESQGKDENTTTAEFEASNISLVPNTSDWQKEFPFEETRKRPWHVYAAGIGVAMAVLIAVAFLRR